MGDTSTTYRVRRRRKWIITRSSDPAKVGETGVDEIIIRRVYRSIPAVEAAIEHWKRKLPASGAAGEFDYVEVIEGKGTIIVNSV
jgi:hypothetical protein